MYYEEKYKEAVERMRNVIIPPETKEGLQTLKETVFPELAESKDERIRKEVVEFIQWAVDRGSVPNEQLQAKRPGEWLAYLEKQKDSKWSPSEDEMGVLYKLCYISKQVTDEDDTELTRLYQDLKREYFNGHSFENMFPSEKQKEQKPAEWSEEDEKVFKNLCAYLENERDTAITEFDTASFTEYVQWLEKRFKFLRPQPKQEWSEDDKKNWEQVLACITDDALKEWLEKQKARIIADIKSNSAPPKKNQVETEHQCDCEHVGCHINNCRRWCRRYMAEIPYTYCGPTCSGYSHKNTGGISVQKPTWTGNDSMALVSLEAIINNSNHDEDRKKELLDWLLTRVQNGFSHTPEEKEFVRTIKSLVADFIYQKEEVDTSYYQRLVDWVEKRHIESIVPLWTPTEAQMWALQEAVSRSCSSEYGGPLSEMLEMLNRSLGRKTAWEKCKPGATDDNAVAFVYPSPEAWRFANEGTKFSEDMLVVGADREPRMSRCAVNKCYYLPTSKILPPKSVTDKLVAQYGESHGEPAPGGIKSDQ